MFPFSVQPNKKGNYHVTRYKNNKGSPSLEKSADIDQIKKIPATMTKKEAYKSSKLQLQNQSSTFIHENKPLRPATSILSHSPEVGNSTVSLEKLTCSDYVDFVNCQDRFGQFLWSKNDSDYLDVQLKVLKKDAEKDF